ncbi:class I mannose-6-phosphate isomerase [Enorma massiliensis]|mgnify:FL=1|uniref:type I phosphomannose isomerase catalytic subunit n=1 Tax=Enorma massiliensis TaxID=1472761 RepID=UPI001956CBDC|nr:type I phosphomannose isomerase catalytic subunit [Enorma massiliensis]MBM6784145.1 class I mannose-6-phosphate isomerase [Enorma massiliensis]
MESIIELVPVFKEKIWGGRKLETEFGYEIPAGPVGECWAISAHPAGDDEIASGEYAGRTLSWLWDEHRELFGNCEGDRFPLLVKIIDAKDDLSIQVHPDNDYAAEHEDGSLGKKECWYVLSAEPGQTIVVGQRAHSREEFAQMVEEGRWSELLNEIPIKAGDFFQIDPGTVHAIKGGTVILESQQSSDVTYRVYDYDRKQDDGTLRPLHMQQALDVIDFDCAPLTSGEVELSGPVTTLEQNECYTVDLVRVGEDGCPAELAVETPHPFTCISVIEGEGVVNGREVKKGTHLLALSACDALELSGTMQVVLSYL